jgi:hypothetical protein
VTDRLGHDRRYAIDSSFAHRHLNWKPRKNFEHGLTETIKWYMDHQDCWATTARAGRALLIPQPQAAESAGRRHQSAGVSPKAYPVWPHDWTCKIRVDLFTINGPSAPVDNSARVRLSTRAGLIEGGSGSRSEMPV